MRKFLLDVLIIFAFIEVYLLFVVASIDILPFAYVSGVTFSGYVWASLFIVVTITVLRWARKKLAVRDDEYFLKLKYHSETCSVAIFVLLAWETGKAWYICGLPVVLQCLWGIITCVVVTAFVGIVVRSHLKQRYQRILSAQR